MADRARAEIDVLSTCRECGGDCILERNGDKTRMRCIACSNIIPMVAAALGKWTLVDPDGNTSHFSTWQEVMASLPVSGTSGMVEAGGRGARSSSAAALLDVTPALPSTSPSTASERAARLALVPDDPPPLPRSALPHIDLPRFDELRIEDRIEEPPVEERIEEVPDEDIVPASDASLAEILSRASPPVRVSVPPPLPPGASGRPGLMSAPPHSPIHTPPPPKGGTLRTLPPPARRDAPPPPPPTIDVEGKGKDDADIITVGSEAVLKTAARSDTLDADERSASASDTRRRSSASIPPPAAASPPAGRGWVLPVLGLAILASSVWYVTRGSPGESAPTLAQAPPTSGAPQNLAPGTATTAATTSTPSLSASTPSASASGDPTAATGAGATEKRPAGDMQLSLPEVLERAASARKSGDPVHARALLERALELSPGNAEAYGLLGDLARSQGDNAGAKGSYEKALATSPSYFPALLGAADTEWDLGERDAAQRRYIAIIALGRPVPDRVKERALGASPASTAGTAPAATATTPTPATTTTTPPAAESAAPTPSEP